MIPFSVIPVPLFDLQTTLECGQVFHWMPSPATHPGAIAYTGSIGALPVRVEQHGAELRVTKGAETAVRRYFALDHPLEEIYRTFPADPPMQAALSFCRGLRIVRQPLWECLATFILSAMKQVAHIRQMSFALRRRFGQAVTLGAETLHSFPDATTLARATEPELRACGLGFRAGNLLKTARLVADGALDLEAVRRMPDAVALSELRRAAGVGPKVANCVLLFAYERLGAFPIDVWIERVLRERYSQTTDRMTAKGLEEFAAARFGPFGGYAQQYLFHHARNQPRSAWAKGKR